ncbi:heparan-sulfate 6-O-sulfotransferase 3-B isoform X2 [Synchiropus splendidus]|uniref:heparan-sulfate 6-O-sulfotransferase 3-B isoform X2 n=1 Tax=Synchiropus splendidus TaxID=270530 RepID=UPI00237D95B2|nr:heparan-sulfate 6-O-sulfotransferase 3-B isoform X2 [Synchiropus splendidus]
MDERSSKLVLVPILAVLFVMIGYQYICPAGGNSCHLRTEESVRGVSLLSSSSDPDSDDSDDYRDQDLEDDGPPKLPSKFNFTARDLDRHVEFNIKGDDVIVFLHIQKTGGTTFGRHLVRNIRLEQPCDCKPGQKKCTCHRPGKDESWLFSRFSTGWSCGLHADWTELTNCVPVVMGKKEAQRNKRNFYYITMLRDPVSRYLSEWKHVQRGATWKTALHMCDGRSPTQDELPTCYSGDDWSGVTLTEFMKCPSNLANNRQSQRNHILLSSAKNNLKNMAFYGLTEFQRKTQYLFERTFSLRFISAFTQINSTRAANVDLSESIRRRIEELNFLDVQLYEYAKDLFLQRFQFSRQRQHREVRLKRREERRWLKEQRQQTWPWSPKHRGAKGDGRLDKDGDFPATTEDYTSQVARW